MGRKYIIDTDFQTVSVAQDLLEVVCPSGSIVVLHSLYIDQSSDETSTEAEKLQVKIKRAMVGQYTSGSGGGTVTPTKLERGDPAAQSTAERNNTTVAVDAGGMETQQGFVWDVLAGLEFTPTPEMRPVFSPSEAFIINLAEAPADALTAMCKVTIEEIGG